VAGWRGRRGLVSEKTPNAMFDGWSDTYTIMQGHDVPGYVKHNEDYPMQSL